MQTHRLRGTTTLAAAFAELFEEHKIHSGTRDELILQQGNARGALHAILIEIVRMLNQQQTRTGATDEGSELPATMAQAIEILQCSTHGPGAVHRVCKSTGPNYKRLNRQFVEHLGATIPQYWLRERVRRARGRLLQTDMTVTKVATELEFSSSQHFATVFRKITGLTPSAYRNNVLSEASESGPP